MAELLAQLFGHLAVEALRDSKKTIAPPSEGDTNVSLGAASACFGSLGLLFGLLIAVIAVPERPTLGTSFGVVAIFTAIGFACSCVGFHFGRRAPHVTPRHLGIAKYGVVVSALAMVLVVVVLVASAAKIFP